MVLDEYISRVRQQYKVHVMQAEQTNRRLELAERIKSNIEALRNSPERTLNRSSDDLSKSEDPVKVRLYELPYVIAEPILDEMVNRSMSERVYLLVQNGSDEDITRYAASIYHQKMLDPGRDKTAKLFSARDYHHVQKYLSPTLPVRLGRIIEQASQLIAGRE